MRTLHADLTTAQQASTGTPYLEITLTARIGTSTQLTYTTADSPNRIVSVKQAESRADGIINIAGAGRSVSAVIRLRDADASIGGTRRIGYRVDIGWGFNTSSGNRVSYGSPSYVFSQRRIALEGEIYLELLCVSQWDLLSSAFASIVTSGLQKWQADTSIRHILQAVMGGFGLTAVVQLDGAVYTDYTAESISITADDVILLSATPQINDAVYYGHTTRFTHLSHDLTDPGTGQVAAWEYWNGSAWAALSNVVDGGDSFKTGELKITSFDSPGTGWSSLNLFSTSTEFPNSLLYYVRARLTSSGTDGTTTRATRITAGNGEALALDEATASFNEAYKPIVIADWRVDSRTLSLQLLAYTQLGVVLKNDGFHLVNVDPNESTLVYTYSTTHIIYSDRNEFGSVLPNTFIFSDVEPDNTVSSTNATASDSTSVTEWGAYTRIVVDNSINADAGEAATLAGYFRDQQQVDANQGFFIAPMNCGQEVWDYIRVIDPWTSVTYDGHVTTIIRTYEPGLYEIEISLGGYESIIEATDMAGMRIAAKQQELQELQTILEQTRQAQVAASTGVSFNVIRQLEARLDAQEFRVQVAAMENLQAQARAGQLSQGVVNNINIAQAIQELQAATIDARQAEPNRIGEIQPVMTLSEIMINLMSSVSQGMQATDSLLTAQHQQFSPEAFETE